MQAVRIRLFSFLTFVHSFFIHYTQNAKLRYSKSQVHETNDDILMP